MSNRFLVISTSLNKDSRSKIMASQAYERLKKKEGCEWLDLQEIDLPFCDGGPAYEHSNVPVVSKLIRDADGIILSIPIYNFASGSAAKNLIELTGRAWTEKTVGFLCAAGGKSSYMSVMGLANSLMLDFRSIIVPSFVYADKTCFDGSKIVDEEIEERIDSLIDQVVKIATSLKTAA